MCYGNQVNGEHIGWVMESIELNLFELLTIVSAIKQTANK